MVKYLKIFIFYSYDKIIKLDPDNYLGWMYKGDLLKELKRYDEAL